MNHETVVRTGQSAVLVCLMMTLAPGHAMAQGTPTTKPTAVFILDDHSKTPASSLYKCQLDGGGLIRLTEIETMNIETFWASPGGNLIIGYRSSDFGVPYSTTHTHDLVIMDGDGRIIRTIDLAGLPLIQPNSPPMLLADGKRIGLVAVQPKPQDPEEWVLGASITNIVTVNLDGKDVQTIATIPGGCSSASWSPDGKTILYTAVTIGSDGGQSYLEQRLWTMDANGMNRRPLLPANTSAGWFSPDGRRIVYLKIGEEAAEVMVADADGGNTKQLTNIGATLSSPRWLADGKTIAFFRLENAKARWGSVWAVDTDGTNLRQLSPKDQAAWMDRSADKLWYGAR